MTPKHVIACAIAGLLACAPAAAQDALSDKELRQRLGWADDRLKNQIEESQATRDHIQIVLDELNARIEDKPVPIPPPPPSKFPASQPVADLCSEPVNPMHVAPGELDDAIAAISADDPPATLVLDAGIYPHTGSQNVNLVRATDLTICGNGATLEPETASTNVAKALITTAWKQDGDITTGTLRIYDLNFRGARNTDRNGSGIRVQGSQSVECHRCTFSDMDSGILAGEQSDVWVTDSLFDGIGNDGFSHGIYANTVGGSLIVERSEFRNTFRGMHLKSLAALTIVRDNTFTDMTLDGTCGPASCASRQVEITRGGDALIEGNTFTKQPEAENHDVIFYGLSRGGEGGRVIVRDNAVTNTHTQARFIRNRTCSTIEATGNTLTGFGDPPEYGGGLISVDGGDAAARIADSERVRLGTDGDDSLSDALPGGYFQSYTTQYGFAGNDTLHANAGGALLLGCEGDDHLLVSRLAQFSAGPGDDTIELTGLDALANGSCGAGYDVVVMPGPYEPDAADFRNRQWGKDRWMVKVVGGFPNKLHGCEEIRFSDGYVFHIPAL